MTRKKTNSQRPTPNSPHPMTHDNNPPEEPAAPVDKPAGLECPHCGCRHFYVWKTVALHGYIRRTRICRHCDRRITTKERIIEP